MSVIIGIMIATLHAVRPLLFVQRTVVIQCLVIALMLLTFIIRSIISGSALNKEFDSHRYVRSQLDIRDG